MGHTEVTKPPCEAGGNGQHTVALARAENIDLRVRGCGGGEEREVAVIALGVLDHDRHTTGGTDRQNKDEDEYRYHHDRLHEVGRALGQIATEEGVHEYEYGRDDHHAAVGQAEQIGEQLAAGAEALSRVDAEEDDDDERGQRHEPLFLLMEAAGEVVRDGERIHRNAVAAQTAGDDQEVEIRSQRQTDTGPADVRETRPIRKTGQTHQQIAGHIRGLRAERRHPRAEAAAAEEVGLRVAVGALGEIYADRDDCRHVYHHGDQMLYICSDHVTKPPLDI